MHCCLANKVAKKYRWRACASVILLYLVPTVWVVYKVNNIWFTSVPLLETSMSKDWGTLPNLSLCSRFQRHSIAACHLQSFESTSKAALSRATPSQGPDELSNSHNCTLSGPLSESAKSLTSIHPTTIHKSHDLTLECVLLEATSLTPRTPSVINFFVAFENRSTQEQTLGLFVNDEELTAVAHGTTLLALGEERSSVRFNLSHDNFWWKIPSPSYWWNHLSPSAKTRYRAWLKYHDDHWFVYDPMETFRHLVFSNELESRLDNVEDDLKYNVAIRIETPYVMESVEWGRYAQIVLIVSSLGGYLSFLSACLGACWVQRYPDSHQAKIYDSKTFALDAGSEKPPPMYGELSADSPSETESESD